MVLPLLPALHSPRAVCLGSTLSDSPSSRLTCHTMCISFLLHLCLEGCYSCLPDLVISSRQETPFSYMPHSAKKTNFLCVNPLLNPHC